MKRFIYCIRFIFLWLVFSNFQCNEEPWVYSSWHVHNKTTETLIINITKTIGEPIERVLKPGETVPIIANSLPMDVNHNFEQLYEVLHTDSLNEGKVTAVVKSENGDVLKTWTYVQREDAGRQFFAEKYWPLAILNGGMDFIWVFSILPEDLPNQ